MMFLWVKNGIAIHNDASRILIVRVFLLMVLCVVSTSPVFSAPTPIEKNLLAQIASSQKQLARIEGQVLTERQALAEQLNALESAVAVLREKTVVARRLADEQSVSLSTLTSRLARWREQQSYQQNALNQFFKNPNFHHEVFSYSALSDDLTHTKRLNLADQLQRVRHIAEKMRGRFEPHWSTLNIVLPTSEVLEQPSLHIGPLVWYWNERDARAGFARTRADLDAGVLYSELELNAADSDRIAALRNKTQGDIVFDPTLTRATMRQHYSESLLEHVGKGGVWVIPILFFACLAMSIAVIKAVQLWRLPKVVSFKPSVLRAVFLEKQVSVEALQDGAALSHWQKNLLDVVRVCDSSQQRDDQLFMQLQAAKHSLERGIGIIAITAAVSPLLGLLGTVSGMIETFNMMTLFGSGDPEVVSGGIAKALVTTELGLVVAIPSLIFNAILSRKAKNYYCELENVALTMSQLGETGTDENEKPMKERYKKDSHEKVNTYAHVLSEEPYSDDPVFTGAAEKTETKVVPV